LRFFALRVTVEPEIPGAGIPRRVFTQPGSFATGTCQQRVRPCPLCPESGSRIGIFARASCRRSTCSQRHLLGAAIRRTMARSAGVLWPMHHLLQPFRPVAKGRSMARHAPRFPHLAACRNHSQNDRAGVGIFAADRSGYGRGRDVIRPSAARFRSRSRRRSSNREGSSHRARGWRRGWSNHRRPQWPTKRTATFWT
jgi:hypothetical protein